MGAEVHERRSLEHDLRHAVARGEMELVYQPQTEVGTGEVIGFEALLRWRHPERGHVPPSVFIPIAEESDIILRIGEWVLREACREAAGWPRPLSIAVNVSAVQIHSPDLVGLVHEVLLGTGLAPGRLEVEITETALISDPNRALLTLRQLKAVGVRVAMDDFGTGYSSLSNLRSFPFDKIKIDGSFTRAVDTNEQTAAIVRSVLGLGRGLGLPVLAEGSRPRPNSASSPQSDAMRCRAISWDARRPSRRSPAIPMGSSGRMPRDTPGEREARHHRTVARRIARMAKRAEDAVAADLKQAFAGEAAERPRPATERRSAR